MSGLLATKLHQPSIPSRRVERPYLVQRLNDGLQSGRQMTLISAPAGFGKSTCAAEWVSGLDVPVAWLSLDSADDDPGRFFSYLVAALQQVDANVGQEIEPVLRAGQLPPAEIISTTLINDILDLDVRFLLVLDDFQVLQDRFILQVLEKLLVNLLPPLHLVLITREDPSLPLARLRANNQLTEVRAGDLRFSRRDVDLFMNEVMGLSLSSEDIDVLDDRTEGWVVGLQLVAIAMQSPPPTRHQVAPSHFIAGLSGSHRHILSYLTEEVLERQPEEIQQFLLQTSILDRLCGDLCDAVTGRTDSAVLLERLLADNLFLTPLDDEQRWYRYHHLFVDLLRDRQKAQQKDQTAGLHQRASHWYVQMDTVEHGTFVSEAIHHALAAADYALAVNLIESHALDMLMQWHVKTVEGWMRSIPPEWIKQSPQANLAFAWVHMMHGAYAQASPYLQRLPEMFADPQMHQEQPPSLKAKWLALQAMLFNAQGRSAESAGLCNQALEMAPAHDSQVRSMIYLGLAGAYQQMEDYAHAVDAFQVLMEQGRETENSVTELLGISGLALLAIQHGQYHFAFEITSRGIERIERSGTLPPVSTAVYGELGVIHYQWHQLEEAHSYFRRAIQVSVLSGFSDAEVYYWVVLSRLFQTEGDLERAAREIQKAVDLMPELAIAGIREEVTAQQVRISLAQDHLAAAEAALKGQGFSFEGGFSFPDPASGQNTTLGGWLLYPSALRILLYRAQTRGEPAGLKSGIELADRLIAGALQHRYVPFALETLLLRAQMHVLLGNRRAGLDDIANALEIAEPERFISVFVEEGPPIAQALAAVIDRKLLGSVQVDYVQDILDAFSGSQPSSTKDTSTAQIALLTDRELDVLRLMAEGLTYDEIAEKLFISLNTVRSHVKTIYSKLDANNRTKALDEAHRLRLL